MTKIKKIAIYITVILFIIIIISLILINKNNKNNKYQKNNENSVNLINNNFDVGETLSNEEAAGIEKNSQNQVENNNNKELTLDNVFIIYQSINRYIHLLNKSNEMYYLTNASGENVFVKNLMDQSIFDTLSENYIQTNNITVSNVSKYIEEIDAASTFMPFEIKPVIYDDTNCMIFLVKGTIENTSSNELISEVNYLVYINEEDLYFAVEPIKNANNIKAKKINIQQTSNNSFDYPIVTDAYIAQFYGNQLKIMLLTKPEIIYNRLDQKEQEYFENIDKFKSYIQLNKEKIISLHIEKYKVNKYDLYTQYELIDKYNNKYTLNEESPLNYSLILYDYIVETDDYVSTYSKYSDSQKINANIEKIQKCINNKDYKYIYNKLNEEFKQRNFNSTESLQSYLSSKLYNSNSITITNTTENGDYYVVNTSITDQENESNTTNINFIIKLKDSTDFEFSFNVE